MKYILAAFCAIVFGVALVLGTPLSSRGSRQLGNDRCTWGPTYWCSNFSNAKDCRAVHHCIQTVWEKQTVPEDNDKICQICLDMVKQARDQLESNETQNDLRLVFEGSCKLIHIKPIVKECDKIVDDFIPELVEALASQMNPQVVCSVAGLCNNAAIDVMLEEYVKSTTTEEPQIENLSTAKSVEKKQLSCSGCNNVASIITTKFHASNRDDVLENMLHLCGKLSSFSDACSNIVLSYFNEIYNQLSESLTSEGICHISGVCSSKYHQHPEIVEIRPMSDVGVVPVKDDIPCELCEQLIRHLRDLLVANTTESEFKQVLEGLCKQTKGFQEECLSIVDQYYDVIYQSLVNNLDENGACFLIGVCPKGLQSKDDDEWPVMPLVPLKTAAKVKYTLKPIPDKKILGEDEPKLTNEQIQSMQLPIDRLMGPPRSDLLVENGQLCTLCEYFLHFVQEALATPANEDKIKEVVGSTCNKLPTSLQGECHNFVDMYGDAIIALLIQGMDPRQVCPMLKMCPENVKDMEVFAPQPIDVSISTKSEQSDKPTCPLCLFAVQQAQEMIKSDKSKENIKHALNNLCIHLPKKLQDECVDFVNTYSPELIEMLITDFTPQQICVYIKLCPDSKPDLSEYNIKVESHDDILTNEIPDNTINGQPIKSFDKEYVATPQCMLCEKVITEAEKRIVNKKSREQIKQALEHACAKLRKMKDKCEAYIEKHGDFIVDLIMKEMTPKQICRELGYCSWNEFDDLDIDEALKIDVIAIPSKQVVIVPLEKMTGQDDIITVSDDAIDAPAPPCVICEFVMVKLEQELKDKKTQEEIKQAVKNICSKLPKTISANCNEFVTKYGDMIITLIDTVPPKEICQNMNLCMTLGGEVNDEVEECGVCHGAVVALVPLINEQKEKAETQEMIDTACENLPAKYYEKCSELVEYYGESIYNLVKGDTHQSKICAQIGKCFETERAYWSYMLIGGDGTVETTTSRYRRSDKEELVGSNPCTWGPSHWCSKQKHAEKCGTTTYCEDVWKENGKPSE